METLKAEAAMAASESVRTAEQHAMALATVTEQLNTLKASAAESEAASNAAREQAQSVKQVLEEMNGKVADLERQLAQLKGSLEAAEKEAADSMQRAQTSQTQLTAAEAKLDSNTLTLAKLKAEIETLKAAVEEAHAGAFAQELITQKPAVLTQRAHELLNC